MANIKYSAVVSDAAGAIGGVVFSRGKGGAIARGRRKPINPRSTTQNTRRAIAAYLAKYWSNDLTAQQRLDWAAYAAGTSWTNKLGDSIQISGNAAFMRLNTLYWLRVGSVRAAAPTAMGHGGGVDFSFTAENDTSKLQIAEPGGAFDKDTDFHTLILQMGLPSEAGRLSTPKGMKYVGYVYGCLAVPQAFPVEIDAAYTMQADQLVTVRAMFYDGNFRVSGPFFATATAAPSI